VYQILFTRFWGSFLHKLSAPCCTPNLWGNGYTPISRREKKNEVKRHPNASFFKRARNNSHDHRHPLPTNRVQGCPRAHQTEVQCAAIVVVGHQRALVLAICPTIQDIIGNKGGGMDLLPAPPDHPASVSTTLISSAPRGRSSCCTYLIRFRDSCFVIPGQFVSTPCRNYTKPSTLTNENARPGTQGDYLRRGRWPHITALELAERPTTTSSRTSQIRRRVGIRSVSRRHPRLFQTQFIL
jgi:hypothetical protein